MHVGDDAHSHRAPLASLAESGRRVAAVPPGPRGPAGDRIICYGVPYLARC